MLATADTMDSSDTVRSAAADALDVEALEQDNMILGALWDDSL